MMGLGTHASFIIGSYLLALAILAGLALWIVADNRARRRELDRMLKSRNSSGLARNPGP